jgi:hypothetical protein
MWTLPIHLSGSACNVTAVLVVLGVSARPVFRYPHMWRYMELRLCMLRDRRSGNPTVLVAHRIIGAVP